MVLFVHYSAVNNTLDLRAEIDSPLEKPNR